MAELGFEPRYSGSKLCLLNLQSSPSPAAVCMLSCSVVSDSAIPWAIAHQVVLSMEFSRQEYWSGVLFSTSGVFLTQGSNPCLLSLLHLQVYYLLLPRWYGIDICDQYIPNIISVYNQYKNSGILHFVLNL